MEISYWKSRWKKDKTGWQMSQVYPNLKRYWSDLNAQPGDRVLVPMCGKSKDLQWLADQGHEVIGVEVSETAAQSFFEEHRIEYTTDSRGPFTIYHSKHIEIWMGDFFRLQPGWIPGIEVIYDKAALIALPEKMRTTYAQKVLSFSESHTQIFLNTFEYRQEEMNGPPFAVFRDELQELFGEVFEIELLQEESIFEQLGKFRARGLSSYLVEKVYLLSPKT